ncbi:MAG TPA: extracellular solute-binding protein, partial [Aggregatilineales bacterium]|nr:extracellular solute-binding protein [Aggregatilineales bacterium]
MVVRKTLRRAAVALLLAVLVFPPLVGYATPTGAPRSSQEPASLKVVWMISPSDSEDVVSLVETFARDFEAENSGVKINIEYLDWSEGRDSLLHMVEDGTPPDLAVIGARWVPEFVSRGLIEPLDGFLTLDFTERFVPSIIEEGAVYLGRTFGLPVATSTRALYYNRDIFADAGLDQ